MIHYSARILILYSFHTVCS